MLLTLDIGNTNIKAGFFKDNNLIESYNFKEISALETILNKFQNINIAISSVVPEKTEEIIKKISGSKPFVVTKDVRFNLQLKYKTPETLGLDRICSTEGAFNLLGKNLVEGTYLLTIDFGTATTINIVKYPNYFIGGLIAPGVNTMFKSLSNQTSQLPELKIEEYISVIGDDTNSSIASGVINSTIGLIEKTTKYISNLNDCERIVLYATGGIAGKLQKYLSKDIIYDEFLVLRGIKVIYDLNNS
jgi:type III pantothenate kinase